MSDTKLRPEDLTATVREMYPPPPPLAGWLGFYYDSGFYDSEQGKREDAGWYCSGKVHADREEALCELAGFRPFEGSAIVEVNRALFAPAPEKAAKVELGKVRELIFMVRNLTPYLAQLGYADLSRSFNDYADAALAELDAFEKEG